MSHLSEYLHCGHRCDEGNTRKLLSRIRRGNLDPYKIDLNNLKRNTSAFLSNITNVYQSIHYTSTDTSYTRRKSISFVAAVLVFVPNHNCTRSQITLYKLLRYLLYYSYLCSCRLKGSCAQNMQRVLTRRVLKTICFVSVAAAILLLAQ